MVVDEDIKLTERPKQVGQRRAPGSIQRMVERSVGPGLRAERSLVEKDHMSVPTQYICCYGRSMLLLTQKRTTSLLSSLWKVSRLDAAQLGRQYNGNKEHTVRIRDLGLYSPISSITTSSSNEREIEEVRSW